MKEQKWEGLSSFRFFDCYSKNVICSINAPEIPISVVDSFQALQCLPCNFLVLANHCENENAIRRRVDQQPSSDKTRRICALSCM